MTNLLEIRRKIEAAIASCPIRVASGRFGVASQGGVWRVNGPFDRVCPLGALLLGKPSPDFLSSSSIIEAASKELGVTREWTKDFVNGVDNIRNKFTLRPCSSSWAYRLGCHFRHKLGLE